MDNVEEEGSRNFGDPPDGKGFKAEWMYDVRECIFQFTAKPIPIQARIANREKLQTTEGELKKGK